MAGGFEGPDLPVDLHALTGGVPDEVKLKGDQTHKVSPINSVNLPQRDQEKHVSRSEDGKISREFHERQITNALEGAEHGASQVTAVKNEKQVQRSHEQCEGRSGSRPGGPEPPDQKKAEHGIQHRQNQRTSHVEFGSADSSAYLAGCSDENVDAIPDRQNLHQDHGIIETGPQLQRQQGSRLQDHEATSGTVTIATYLDAIR